MASAKKKAPTTKQKAAAAKKTKIQVKTKAVKATARAVVKKKVPAAKKAKVQVKSKVTTVKTLAKAIAKKNASATKKARVQIKAAVKKKIINTKAAAKAKPRPKVQTKAKATVKAAAKKAVATPSRKKIVPQKKSVAKKTGKTSSPAIKTAVSKKGPAVVPVTERFRGLKGMLVAKRDALLREAKQEIQKYVSGENRQLVDTAIDEADWAAVEISEDINLKRLSAQRQLLNDVEECLRKVNEGTYGVCEDCGEEISEKRLHVIPTATLCIDCKEQREKMAILEQETEV